MVGFEGNSLDLKSLRESWRRPVTVSMFSVVKPSGVVLSSRQGGYVVILSLHDGRYHTLDEQGSRIWLLVGDGTTVGRLLQSLAAELDADPEMIAGDVKAFVIELIRRRFLDLNPPAPRSQAALPTRQRPMRPTPAVPSLPKCVVSLIVLALALRTMRLGTVWRHAHGLTRCLCKPASQDYIHAVVRQVVSAAALSPLRAQCLEQSLLTLALLRRAGVDARLRFGVLQFPFRAHAWVEVDGAPINDSQETLKLYRPFSEFEVGA
jgi:hypothetical protein